jgi:hypothetical protein
MPDVDVEVRVILCPDQSLSCTADQADPTWPRPEGVQLELQGPTSPQSDPTGLGGTTKIAGVDAAEAYAVAVITPGLAGWTPHTPRVGSAELAGGVLDVVLCPPGGRRLVTAKVTVGNPAGSPSALSGETVKARNAGASSTLSIFPDGMIYALGSLRSAAVEFEFSQVEKVGQIFAPPVPRAQVRVPSPDDPTVYTPVFCYTGTSTVAPWSGISVEPLIKGPSGKKVPLAGALVTLATVGSSTSSDYPPPVVAGLVADETEVRFANLDPGLYTITVETPPLWQGWPMKAAKQESKPYFLSPGEQHKEVFSFEFTRADLSGSVQAPGGKGLDQDVSFEIFGADGLVTVTAGTAPFTALVPSRAPLNIRLAAKSKPTVNGIPLAMSPPEQLIASPAQGITVSLQYEHGVQGQAVDEQDNALPGTVIIAYDEASPGTVAGRAVAGTDGSFTVGVKTAGTYGVAFETKDGQPVTLTSVSVNSVCDMGKLVYRPVTAAAQANGSSSPPGPAGSASPGPGQAGMSPPDSGAQGGGGGKGNGSFALPREAFTDLASYPVLTEEITTTGVPAPVSGGTAGTGAGYGPAVDQVIRDVLGWRPSGDVAGFQAALNGAFQLKEVQGHTEWTWQQRGYAVQADMGALTGAQASIYARAKSALDQITPLLTGLTAINPALYPPQDLEAIRTIVSTELNELVTELALEGGPRIQRVDELFGLLLGSHRSRNPDRVNGQLGQLRDRFGLTVDEVNTLDEERMITNFRVIVDQVMSLEASWQTDKKLFSRESIASPDSRTSFGTVLIWLSRSLEAVCESVDDLTFAMDSVFVDAAQRQVIELRFDHLSPEMTVTSAGGPKPPGEPPILLSDLLDWVTRASRDEGPRIIQDAGKDGVVAFAPVLERLRFLIRATRDIIRDHHGLPPGLRTPRVKRAFDVLADQLKTAAELAVSVRRQEPPTISAAWVGTPSDAADGNFFDQVSATSATPLPSGTKVNIGLLGSGFRADTIALLQLDGRPDLPEQQARVNTSQPSVASVEFAVPPQLHHAGRATWLVSVANRDGTHSNEVPVDIDLGPVSGRRSSR